MSVDGTRRAGTLEARNLVKDFHLRSGFRTSVLHAVKDVSFTLEAGRTTALVGESGSGKSTIARMLMKLETPTSGSILLDGEESGTRGSALERYRSDVQMVFQDPFASLNPFHTIVHHLERPIRLHHPKLDSREVRARAIELLERVRLTPGESFAERRPHELSGGQRQRVAIARALAPGARFIVADEPVSMLDVSIRLGVLNLVAELQREENLGVLYITHDLATARHFSDDIMVLFQGDVVERGTADEVILNPQHEYTKTLLAAAPEPENLGRLRDEVRAELALGS
ncbi:MULTISPECIES: ABC transporter ATP-binding protein [unclassified Microbacterium]|uniref:ABC transporter ATP-binding protein n=1 Tax=unclassified Microbacterium TaxID=2609290 RepID=UPI0024697856|nr:MULTISPECIES: ATP-binding cassette domain-containing protein [unclassified Microbacterium]MDH5134639.1 ATP-binding cassette domain-containing protein [Microbacterium sp. RD10]MDH5138205.1 ATP-binding cassette domain-containing protein [Microbacterium sp. RD11]MDH5146196.1 ATP-binding cassette domain-containing protein [Microbacterium sp. RD12]MDH5156192.1 ATP-binding cassette domain-containing protein [Microbacterium sp. RD06]MDH5167162.1 ATP-binding cassette domain-containing protein [Micr